MRTFFEPEEDDEYESAKCALVRLCEQWCRADSRAQPDPMALELACDYKHEHGDGHYARWDVAGVEHLLLVFFPYAVVLDEEQRPLVVPSLRVWFAFLDRAGLLDPRAADVPGLNRALDAVAPRFLEAMADDRRWGPGKLIGRGLAAHGLDPADPGDVERYAGLVQDGRADIHPVDLMIAVQNADRLVGAGGRQFPQLPVALPPRADLAARAGESTIVKALTGLAGWAGTEGRVLTATMRVKPGDAALLAARLDTGDLIPASGKVRSVDDLPHLARLIDWGKRARLLRQYGGRLVQVKAATADLADPLKVFRRAFEALFAMREEFCWIGDDVSPIFPVFEDVLQDVLFAVYSLPAPGAPVGDLADSVWASCTSGGAGLAGYDARLVRAWRAQSDATFAVMRRALIDLGAARETGPRGPGRCFELTDLGTWAVRERLLAVGRSAPLIGEYAAADAHTLLYALLEDHSPDSARAEVAAWLAYRGADWRVSADASTASASRRELVDALRRTILRNRKYALLALLCEVLPEGRGFAESLVGDPDLAGTAYSVLIDADELDFDAVSERGAGLGLADTLARLLELGGAPALAENFVPMPAEQVTLLLDTVVGSGHPHADRVVTAAGRPGGLAAGPARG